MNNDFSVVELQNNDIWLRYDNANLTIRDLRNKNKNTKKCGLCSQTNEKQLLQYQYYLLFKGLTDEECIKTKENQQEDKHKISYIETIKLNPIQEYSDKICLSSHQIQQCHYPSIPIYLSNDKNLTNNNDYHHKNNNRLHSLNINQNNTLRVHFYCIYKTDNRSDKILNVLTRQNTLISTYHNMLAYVKKTNAHGNFSLRSKKFNKAKKIIQNELKEIDSAINEWYTNLGLQGVSSFEQIYQIPKLCKFLSQSLLNKN